MKYIFKSLITHSYVHFAYNVVSLFMIELKSKSCVKFSSMYHQSNLYHGSSGLVGLVPFPHPITFCESIIVHLFESKVIVYLAVKYHGVSVVSILAYSASIWFASYVVQFHQTNLVHHSNILILYVFWAINLFDTYIFSKLLHHSKILRIKVSLLVFQLLKSIIDNELHHANIPSMFVTLLVFHQFIHDKSVKLLHHRNIELISVTLLVSHQLIHDKSVKLLHHSNIPPILITLFVFHQLNHDMSPRLLHQ